jgi:hypothetical protein
MGALLIDANLLILYVVGILDEDLIDRHKRTRKYSKEDWEELRQFILAYRSLVTTPSVLTEASNLLSFGMTGKTKSELFDALGSMILERLDEKYTPVT